ncbi:MAG: chitobiase/beta-hexosaminidase C-terminal domain-containing protein [Prevotella sp.]|nr:chitobiase/beta-hexosaminidase C-terminal domain-containing protein [Prevotella sp.]
MNKLLRFSLMTLLCAVFGFAYGQSELESPWSHTFSTTDKTFTADGTETLSGADWTLAVDWADPTLTDYNKDSSKGMKIGSNSKIPNGLTLSSSSFPGTITQVSFTFAARSKSTINVAVTVGGVAFEAPTTQFYNQQSLQEVVFTGTGTGEIVISIQHDEASEQNGAIYMGQLGVEFTSSAKAAKPVITPEDGSVFLTESQEVTITTTTTGATIHYTVNDGAEQTYTGPFTITETSTITAYASADGMDDSAVATATITKKVAPESDWYESFDNMNGVGGNDGTWKGITQTPAFEGADQEWTVENTYAGYRCASIRKNGSLTTSGLNLEGDGTLNFSAEAWGTDTGNFYVAIVGDGTFVEDQAGVELTEENTVAKVSLNKTGTWKEHSLQFTGITTSSEFKFYLPADKRGFLDEVYFVMGGETPPVVEVPVPTFSPAAGEVEAGSTVTIAAESDDYEVYYTVDGTSPIDNSSALGGDATVTVTINEAVTIKAAAMDDEGNWSEVVEAAYTVKAAVVIEEPVEEELPEGTLFWEQFSQVNGTGGRDGAYTGSIASSDIFGNSEDGEHLRTTDMIWEYMSKDYKCYGASACMKFGSSSVDGECMTREIALSDAGTLTFSAAGWGSGTNTLTIQVMNGFLFDEGETQSTTKTVTLTNGSWEDYSFNIVKAESSTSGGNLQIHFTGRRGFIDDIKVVEAGAVVANTPTITPEGGIFTEPVQVTIASDQSNASIYYTLDGTDPTDESTAYTGPFMLNETTTVKAIAYIGETPSNVTSATFTFPTVCNNIAEFRQLEVGETAILKLTDAQVLVVAGNNVYVRDNGSDPSLTANAICFYQCNLGSDVVSGSVISGQLTGKRADYNGLPEITNATDVNITVNGVQGSPSWVKNVENQEDVTIDNYVADLIMFKGKVTKNGNNFFIGDIQLYVNNQVAAANSVYGGEVQSGDKIADLVEDGKFYLVAGIFTSYGSSKTPELLLMHVEEKDEEVNVEYTFNSYGIGTLYYSDLRFGELPKGVQASYITGIENKELTEQFLTTNNGYFIPCGCPVILRGTPNSTVTLQGKKKSVEGETFDNNMLRGTDEEESCELADAEYLYYQLSAKDGEPGFYWGAEEGAPFTNGAHKAFLPLTPDQAAMSPAFYFDGTATSITSVTTDGMLDLNAPMYNLSGQRVDKSFHGIVIQNGKKVIKK